MNFKGLPHKTEWVEYPDIEALGKRIGAKPTEKKPDGRDHYTLPIIQDPATGAVVSDSLAIAKYLDATYPDTPKVFPPRLDALQAAFLATCMPTYGHPLFYMMAGRIPLVLNPRSAEYFRTTREAIFGKPLEELHSPQDWEDVQTAYSNLRGFLRENGEGKDTLFAGDVITYCDIQIASLLVWFRDIFDKDSEEWKRIRALDGGFWGKFMKQFEKYETIV